MQVQDDGDRMILIGDKCGRSFPAPQDKDGKWAFDTEAGIEEIVNRRVGRMKTRSSPQRLCRCPEGLCRRRSRWRRRSRICPETGEHEARPTGSIGRSSRATAIARRGPSSTRSSWRRPTGDGYFGYHFRILRAQGNNMAGGRYDYVINGNMIAGFGLIAWPAQYARTGVNTFVVNQAGIVYQKDLGRTRKS